MKEENILLELTLDEAFLLNRLARERLRQAQQWQRGELAVVEGLVAKLEIMQTWATILTNDIAINGPKEE